MIVKHLRFCRSMTVLGGVALLSAGVAGLAGCRSPSSGHSAPPPPWVLYPKPADSVYCYFIGSSANQSSPAAAREEAFQDALRQISRKIVSEAGLGLAALPPGGILLPLAGAEMTPGCFYYEKNGNAYAGYVQVSFPITEKRKVVDKLRNP